MVPPPVPRALNATKGNKAPLDPQVAPIVPRDDMETTLVRHRKTVVAYASLVSTRILKVLPSASHALKAKHHSNRAPLFTWSACPEHIAHPVTHARIVILASLPLQLRQHAPKPNLDSTRIPIKRGRHHALRAHIAALSVPHPTPHALIARTVDLAHQRVHPPAMTAPHAPQGSVEILKAKSPKSWDATLV
jgi:hypothetical protein